MHWTQAKELRNRVAELEAENEWMRDLVQTCEKRIADLKDERDAFQAENERLRKDLKMQIGLATLRQASQGEFITKWARADSDLFLERKRSAELQAENERLREALQEVEDWDLNWADGLDTNVERIKRLVREELK